MVTVIGSNVRSNESREFFSVEEFDDNMISNHKWMLENLADKKIEFYFKDVLMR